MLQRGLSLLCILVFTSQWWIQNSCVVINFARKFTGSCLCSEQVTASVCLCTRTHDIDLYPLSAFSWLVTVVSTSTAQIFAQDYPNTFKFTTSWYWYEPLDMLLVKNRSNEENFQFSHVNLYIPLSTKKWIIFWLIKSQIWYFTNRQFPLQQLDLPFMLRVAIIFFLIFMRN